MLLKLLELRHILLKSGKLLLVCYRILLKGREGGLVLLLQLPLLLDLLLQLMVKLLQLLQLRQLLAMLLQRRVQLTLLARRLDLLSAATRC